MTGLPRFSLGVLAVGGFLWLFGCGGGAPAATTPSVAAPAGLGYAADTLVGAQGAALLPDPPSSTGGTITAYSVSPALPPGLVLDPGTGVLSGTPTALAATAVYTVTGTNAGGSTTACLTLTVDAAPPAGLGYATDPLVCALGVAITPDVPVSAGGAVTAYTVSPALPAGLSLDPGTGIISGTPGAASAAATYLVTGTNTGGSATGTITLQVNPAAPTGLVYATGTLVCTQGAALAPDAPSCGGGAVASYAVKPALPAGLVLDPGTGILGGNPTQVAAAASYTVTAANVTGSCTAVLSITVLLAPPAGLTYPGNPLTCTQGVPLTPDTPITTGGAAGSYAVNPALPAGLALDPATGIVSGTPTAVTASAGYTVTVSNASGSASVVLTIAVNGPPPPSAATGALLRMETVQSGLVQVNFSDLQAAGFTQEPLPLASLQLTNQGQSVPLQAVSADGQNLASGDYLRFYAQTMDTPCTGTNVYWLSTGGTALAAMVTRDGTGVGAATPLAVFQNTLHEEQDKFAWIHTPGAPAADYWFWAALTAPSAQTFGFQLPGLDEAAGASALTIDLMGTSAVAIVPDHHVLVSLNGTQVASLTWTGETELKQVIALPAGLLQPGANALTLTLPGDTGAVVDSLDLNWFEVQAWMPLQAQGGALAFTVPALAGTPVQVSGFPSAGLQLLDVTDPSQPAFVTPVTGADAGGTYHMVFQDPSTTARSYLALAGSQIQAPSNLQVWQPGALRQATNGADYILITPRAFLEAAAPLCQWRAGQGLRVQAVAVEDIFNEFEYGLPVPDGINAFLGYARANWTAPAPSYVLLLGDATYDYRNRMGTGKLSQVPVHLSITAQQGLTPDDNWYVALDGADEVPSMYIGRLPSASPAQVALVVQKLLGYEQATTPVPAKALFVADQADATFAALCDELADLLPAAIAPTQIYLANYTNFAQCTTDILAAFDTGLLLATYNGHGDVLDWSGQTVLKPADIPLLTNAASLPFTLTLNCENAWFAMPGEYCLDEDLVNATNGGAIAAFGCSGLGVEADHDLMGTCFFQQFFSGKTATIGATCALAKIQAYQQGASSDLLRMYTLIGDPAMPMRMPQ